MGRVQLGHRRLDVDPLGRPRGPRQGREQAQPFERHRAGLVPQGLRHAKLVERAGQHVDRQVGRLELPEHIPGLGLQPPGRVLFLFLQALPDDLDLLVRQCVVVQRLLRLLDTLQHMPDPSEGGVVPRVALDLAPGVGDGTDAADCLPGCPLEPPQGLVAPRHQSLLGHVPGRVLFDLLQEPPERGRRDLHAGEIEPPQRLTDFPQAPLDGPAGPRDALGPLVSRVRTAGLAQPFRRDLPLSQAGDLPAGGLEARRDGPLERLDELVERLQQVADARLAAQLPEGHVDRCGDGTAVVLQVHDRPRTRPPTTPALDDVREDLADSAVHEGRVGGRTRAAPAEQLDRLVGVHHRDGFGCLQRVRIPESGVGGGRPVLQVRQAPGPPLRVGRHQVVAAGRRLRRCGSFFSGRGHALVSTPIAGSRFGGRLGTGLHLGPRLHVLVAGRREDQRHALLLRGAGVPLRSLVLVLQYDLLHHSMPQGFSSGRPRGRLHSHSRDHQLPA